jgi:dienelactone hydrolase
MVTTPAHADPVAGVDYSCVTPVADPDPGTPEWIQRDTLNQYCASLRNRDQLASPAFGFGNLTQGAELYVEQTVDQASDPTHPRGGITTLVPGSKGADPFRTIKRWTQQGRGRVAPISFPAADGATLRGHVFAPPASVPRPKDGYPGVVITDGSVQAYEELYYWAAEDLAANGYVVMTYDVQGQGDSDLFGADCADPTQPPSDGQCQGVPYQQSYNFYQGAEDSLDVFLSDRNPFADLLDRDRVGIAGHSLGAAAVSIVGQCDDRVKTVVAWDNLDPVKPEDCRSSGLTIPAAHQASQVPRVPALGLSNDYLFNTQPTLQPPDPHAKDEALRQLRDAQIDSMEFVFRGATHLTYTYIPLVFQASELQERMASYYTLAWFDRYLRDDPTGFDRLTARAFDDSADRTSIGAGVYDPAGVDPADPYAGNVPYEIEGVTIAGAASFYYLSGYGLHDPRPPHRWVTCDDMRHGC